MDLWLLKWLIYVDVVYSLVMVIHNLVAWLVYCQAVNGAYVRGIVIVGHVLLYVDARGLLGL